MTRKILSGEDRKQAGQQLVLSVDVPWKDEALFQFNVFCAERKQNFSPEFSIEDFKDWFDEKGFAQPRHHNSWGAITTTARRAGLIAQTDKCVKAKSPSAHARLIGLWRAR